MSRIDLITAEKLLGINAIMLQPDNPFTWGSGWISPIYTDNRLPLSYPRLRTFIKLELSRLIMENFDMPDAIAGVATGAIAHGALVADELMLPYVYVRTTPKDHGLENLIEGNLKPGQKVVVVQDLVSTGSSSLQVVETVRNAGCEVIGMVGIFSFEFPSAQQAFKKAGVKLLTLTSYSAMLEAALKIKYIDENDVVTLNRWRENPADWVPDRDDF